MLCFVLIINGSDRLVHSLLMSFWAPLNIPLIKAISHPAFSCTNEHSSERRNISSKRKCHKFVRAVRRQDDSMKAAFVPFVFSDGAKRSDSRLWVTAAAMATRSLQQLHSILQKTGGVSLLIRLNQTSTSLQSSEASSAHRRVGSLLKPLKNPENKCF